MYISLLIYYISGNVEFQPRKLAYHHDEAVSVKNPEVVLSISELLRVKQETLMAALTAKRARASGETLVINYKFPEVIDFDLYLASLRLSRISVLASYCFNF